MRPSARNLLAAVVLVVFLGLLQIDGLIQRISRSRVHFQSAQFSRPLNSNYGFLRQQSLFFAASVDDGTITANVSAVSKVDTPVEPPAVNASVPEPPPVVSPEVKVGTMRVSSGAAGGGGGGGSSSSSSSSKSPADAELELAAVTGSALIGLGLGFLADVPLAGSAELNPLLVPVLGSAALGGGMYYTCSSGSDGLQAVQAFGKDVIGASALQTKKNAQQAAADYVADQQAALGRKRDETANFIASIPANVKQAIVNKIEAIKNSINKKIDKTVTDVSC